ncbi:hypothetical protein [Pedobacter frigoris]|uniref:Uncharacterized protein n=1 Tax=Pedobacter frigoris TaxID=2571272 RepID=A0A4U1CHM1_9SPHI|nr:hypothetical protein [Pedobacter frigoris]TKC06295.1 hypothetical protein FA047_13350 [Pedobacter frigoris]
MEANDKNNKPLNNPVQLNDDAKFENPDVDPGFLGHQDEHVLKGKEDKREHNIDANMSIKEMREGKEGEDQENDALNYKNDRENGAFNPKNI